MTERSSMGKCNWLQEGNSVVPAHPVVPPTQREKHPRRDDRAAISRLNGHE